MNYFFSKYLKRVLIFLFLLGNISEVIPFLSSSLYAQSGHSGVKKPKKAKRIKKFRKPKKKPQRLKRKKKRAKPISKKTISKPTISKSVVPESVVSKQPVTDATSITEKKEATVPRNIQGDQKTVKPSIKIPVPPALPSSSPSLSKRPILSRQSSKKADEGYAGKRDYRRLVMFLDPTGDDLERFETKGSAAILQGFEDALLQRSSPILVSPHIFEMLLRQIKHTFFGMQEHPYPFDYLACAQSSSSKSDLDLCFKEKGLLKSEDLFHLAQVLLSLDNAKMRMFASPKMLLFVPLDTKIPGLTVTDDMNNLLKNLGFNSEYFKQLELLQNPQKYYVDRWFSYEQAIEGLSQRLFEQYFIDYRKEFAIKDMVFNGEQLVSDLDSLFALEDQKPQYFWNIYAIGHGGGKNNFIINLNLDQFSKLLKFLNNEISTNLFVYNTCHGGRSEGLTEPYEKVVGKTLNFTIVSAATSDAVSQPRLSKEWYRLHDNSMFIRKIYDYEPFFKGIEEGSKLSIPLNALLKNSIQEGFALNTPIIRFPGTEWFTTQWKDVGKKSPELATDTINSIGKVAQLRYIASGKMIDVSDPKKVQVLVLQNIDTLVPQVNIGNNLNLHIIRVPLPRESFSNINLVKELDIPVGDLRKDIGITTYFKHISAHSLQTVINAVTAPAATPLSVSQTIFIDTLIQTDPIEGDKIYGEKIEKIVIHYEVTDRLNPRIWVYIPRKPGSAEYGLGKGFVLDSLYGSPKPIGEASAILFLKFANHGFKYHRAEAQDFERRANLLKK